MKVSEAVNQLKIGDKVWVKGRVEYIDELKPLPLNVEFAETIKYISGDDEISLTDPSEKVKIPECVAEWIDFCKERGISLHTAMNHHSKVLRRIEKVYEEMYSWMTDENYKEHEEIFARAWLDGFTVETKRWVVRHKDDCIYFEKFDEDECDFSAIWTYLTEPPAFKFTDKAKAEAVATLVEGSVEEV